MKFLDRVLVQSPCTYALCLNEKDYYKLLKKLNVPEYEWNKHAKYANGATTHYFLNDGGRHYAVVCLGENHKKHNSAELASIISHEATHIWQYITEILGEKEPSIEFEAYSIGNITQILLEDYARQTKRNKKK